MRFIGRAHLDAVRGASEQATKLYMGVLRGSGGAWQRRNAPGARVLSQIPADKNTKDDSEAANEHHAKAVAEDAGM